MESVPQPPPNPSWGPLLGDLSHRPHQRLLGASCCRRPGDDRTGAAAWRQLALAQAAGGSESQFFQLRNGTKSLLLPRGASRLVPENCYSCPNALNRLQGEKRLKSRNWCHRRDGDVAGDVLQRQTLAPSLPDTTSLLQGKLIMTLDAGLGKGINLQDLRD